MDEAHSAARDLLGTAPDTLLPIAAGANSRIYKVVHGGSEYALKRYPAAGPHDVRDRQARERDALELMWDAGIRVIPRFMDESREAGYSLLEWISGEPVETVSASEIDCALAFLSKVASIPRDKRTDDLPLASEACLSGHEIMRQLAMRRGALEEVSAQEPMLATFLDDELRSILTGCEQKSIALSDRFDIDLNRELPPEHRRLIPADFGFHNAIRNNQGMTTFIDFEYFGWDDPVKLSAEFLIHPGTELTSTHRRTLRSGLVSVYRDVDGFETRLDAWMPLFIARWALIMLNVFRSEWRQMRPHLRSSSTFQQVKAKQITKVRKFLDTHDPLL